MKGAPRRRPLAASQQNRSSDRRGLAPLLVAVAGAAFFAEPLAAGAWVGVATISAGVAGLVLAGRARRDGLVVAVANAVVIATYTLVDAHAARLSGSPVAYAAWEAIATALPIALWARVRRGAAAPPTDVASLAVGLLGGAATTASYAIALWAMTHAPVAVVAALRETSIVFALAVGRGVFGERIGRTRLTAAAVVVAGVVVLRLA
ncbi:MAG: EamA family transporter [Phyllobacteriaceae bacterium]|nr:EamA family transporter [Phyllobacteriaceae bacterium]